MIANLGYDVHGPADAPVLLLGSSVGTDREMWRPQLEAFAEVFRVIRYDHRGHGGSEVPDGPYTIADLGGDVLGLLDRLGIPRVRYAGLSLGGMVGMWLAANAPERVERLALCCTSAYLPPAQGWQDRAATVLASGMAAVADVVVARWFTFAFAAEQPDVVAGLRSILLAAPPRGYAGCCEAIGAMDLRGDLARITAPTLVIAGSADPATPPSHGEQIAASIPGTRLEEVEAAHLATVERAAECTRLLIDHLGGEAR